MKYVIEGFTETLRFAWPLVRVALALKFGLLVFVLVAWMASPY